MERWCKARASNQLVSWAPATVVGVVTLAAYAQFLGDYFQGGDTWPHIWTSQVSTFEALLNDLSRPIMYGTVFPDSVALFFRPLSTLSYAFDYAVWGMNPLAFHLTDLVIHLAATLALFALVRMVGLRSWPAVIGVSAFALHPTMASVVPDLPRRHDSLAGMGVFAALALAAWAAQPSTANRRVGAIVVAAGALLGLGELAKESAYVGLLLAPVTAFAAIVAWEGKPAEHWRRILAATLVMGLISTTMFGWRYAVLGGIGGYHDQIPPFARLDIALTNLLQNLLWPLRSVLGRTPRAWLMEIGVPLLVTGSAAVLGTRQTRVAIVYGWVWLLVCGLAQMLTHSVAAWQSYLTVAGFAFVVAGVYQAAIDALRPCSASTDFRRQSERVALVGCALLVGFFQVALLHDSVVFTRYDDWHVAGEIARQYFAAVRPCLEATPPGLAVMLNQYPGGLDDSTDQRRLIAPGILGPYSLAPAIYLVLQKPPPTVNNSTLQSVLHDLPREMTAVCHEDGGAWWIRTDYAE